MGRIPNINVTTLQDAMTTPLHIAVETNSSSTVLLLLKLGADPNFIDAFGETPL